ncbi:MAG: MotA/TolQ/ExbB proton channel family protein [Candidatus Thiosymbion ectosymbiont of Robbea hypermnestra]|nr:MotA/TolQ/ExbB proton channel family protein [Candidatus Thiosymbion ectosymbiont of Robbea hypermnestra]
MLELVPVKLLLTGGWSMALILACSVIATAIVLERLWTLRQRRVMPDDLVDAILEQHKDGQFARGYLTHVRNTSPLGRVLAAGLANRRHSREVMKEAVHDTGRQVVAELGRYINTLGTLASITPLLGLLGTVIGMIEVFSVIVNAGVGDPGALAGGISKALITTAAGLSVAIPTLMFYRYFNGRVDKLAIGMEEQALELVEVIKGERERDDGEPAEDEVA